MAAKRASHEEFFVQLASLIEQAQQKGHGSVFLTQKRLGEDASATKEMVDSSLDLQVTTPTPILIRVSDGDTQSKARVKNKKHVKLSTIVQPDDLEAFFTRYADTCKTGMQSLKKRDRSKRKKDKGRKKKAPEVKS